MATPEQVAELKAAADALSEKESEIRTRLSNLEEANERLLRNIEIAEEAATRASDPAQAAALKKRAADLQAQLNQGLEQEKQLTASLKEVAQQANQARTRARAAQDVLNQQEAQESQKQQQQIDQKAKADTGPATTNAGQTVQNAQTAKDDNASVVNPASAPQVIKPDGRITDAQPPSNSNAIPPATGANGDVDSNTDAPVKPITETQSTNSQKPDNFGTLQTATGAPESARSSAPGPGAVSDDRAGVGAPNDDQRSPSAQNSQTNAVRNRLDELYGGINNAILSQDNVLDSYASYTYSLSWYLMDNSSYQRLINQHKKDLNGYYLLVQSAGAGQPTGLSIADEQILAYERKNPQSIPGNSARSPFFPLDFAIDNLEVEIKYAAGSETQSAAAFTELSFTLTEPNGISLLPNLYRAVDDLVKAGGKIDGKDKSVNYAAALYCMVIRFYGYDENGVLVQPITNERNNTDSRAVVEKFIPFTLKNIDFTVGSRLVEYKIQGATPDIATGLSTNRGSIPQDFEFSGTTVKDLLVGALTQKTTSTPGSDTSRNGKSETATPPSDKPKYNIDSTTGLEMVGYGSYVEPGSAWPKIKDFFRFGVGAGDAKLNAPPVTETPPKADAAPKPTTSTVGTGLISALNNFQAQLVKKGIYEYPDTYDVVFAEAIIAQAKVVPPGGINKNRAGGTPATTAAEKKDPKKSSMNPTVRSRSVRAGTQIVQFIDEVIRNSSYITDQQSVIFNEKTKKYEKNGKPAQQFAWYQISVQAEPGEYDTKRNDYVYRMTFYVTPYAVPILSEYFNPAGFRGVHKVYNYWFTGQNTQVLNFDQKFDQLWTQVLTADTNLQKVSDDQKKQQNSREQYKRHYYSASGQNRQGGEAKTFEAGANAADSLYGTNYAEINLSIIGDPAWIPNAQYGGSSTQFSATPFWPDGTINNSASIPYFEFAWNRPVDYNLETGLMDPGQNNYFSNRREGIAGLAAEAQTYVAVSTKNVFRGGRFFQELQGKQAPPTPENKPENERKAQTPAKPKTIKKAEPAPDPKPRYNIDGTTGLEMVGYGNYVEPGSAWPKVKEFFKFGVGKGDDKLKNAESAPAAKPATSNGQTVSPPAAQNNQPVADANKSPPQKIVREP